MSDYRFINYYRCPSCGHEWEDAWDCQVNDDCGSCGLRHIEPYESEDNPDFEGGDEEAALNEGGQT